MPVPGTLTNAANVHIFRYASNLNQACIVLQQRIASQNQSPPLTTVNTQINPATFGGDAAVNANSRVAWLVGHGIPNDMRIGTSNFTGHPVDIGFIMQWLSENGYTHVVDTCCSPNLRRTANRHGLIYFCAQDGQIVTENQNHHSLDEWWDHNGFAQR